MKTTADLHYRIGPGPNSQFRSRGIIPSGTDVDVTDRHGDWLWVENFGGWSHGAYIRSEPKILIPNGLQAIHERFGHPGSSAASAGRCRLPAPLKIGWAAGSIVQFACHIEMEKVFEAAFQEIHNLHLWYMLRTWDGCYNNRDKTGQPGVKSTHAWGIAVDLNAATNKFGSKGDMPAQVIAAMEKHGFHHLKNDPMHFQFCRGY